MLISALGRCLIALLFMVVLIPLLTIYTVTWHQVALSEEAAMAVYGFPFPMVECGPFYGGYAMQGVSEGGTSYILDDPDANCSTAYEQSVWPPGLLGNALVYSLCIRSMIRRSRSHRRKRS